MVELAEVEAQLKEAGCNFQFFNKPEIKELAKILHESEKIAKAASGYYENGFALMVVTNQRLLLIDKKPLFLTIEDIRFDMIAEINYNYRLLNASAQIFSNTNKSVTFTSWNHGRLRELTQYLQHQIMLMRDQHASAVGDHIHSRLQEQFAKLQQPAANELPALPARTQVESTVIYRDQTPEVVPSLAYVAMQSSGPANARGRNPYAHRMPLLSRRRKFPSFY